MLVHMAPATQFGLDRLVERMRVRLDAESARVAQVYMVTYATASAHRSATSNLSQRMGGYTVRALLTFRFAHGQERQARAWTYIGGASRARWQMADRAWKTLDAHAGFALDRTPEGEWSVRMGMTTIIEPTRRTLEAAMDQQFVWLAQVEELMELRARRRGTDPLEISHS